MAYPSITIAGSPVSAARLAAVSVTQVLNEHWWAVVDLVQTNDQPIPVEQWLGKPLTVTSLDASGAEQKQFSGFVVSGKLSYESSGTFSATVKAVSQTWLMDQAMRKQYYPEQGLAAVSSDIAGRASLQAAVNVPDGKPLNYVQYGETDFSLLCRIVDDHNAWLRPSAGGFEVFNSFQAGSTLSWRGDSGLGLLEFALTGTLKPASFDGAHYDFHTMESQNFTKISRDPAFYSSSSGLAAAVQQQSTAVMPSGFAQQRARVMTLEEYRQSLEDESERSVGSAVVGTGASRNQALLAGNTVTLTGSMPAAGTYGLTKVVHRWTSAGYSNEFTCTPWKQYRNAEEPALRSWNGVVPARVVDHNDPGKMGRIKVQFFWQDAGSTHWARAASPHAGPGRGFMFLPEVGDEVAVAFEDGDPERPMILGSLWNGVQQAPRDEFRGADIANNDVKRFISKAGNRMQISDLPGKETVLFATPHSTRMVMTEEADETGRTLVLLESAGDIILSAPNGRVHIQSQFFSGEIGIPQPKAKAAAAKPGGKHAPVYDRAGNVRKRYNFTYSPAAIAAAQAAEKKYGVPASVTLAQYGLESSAGKRMPPDSNNPFGIKAKGDEPYVTAMTHEVRNGQLVTVPQNFRQYDSIDQAFDDHGRLLGQAPVYANARQNIGDSDAFADSLGGVYAPNVPNDYTYGEKLGYIMDDGNLRQYNVGK